MPVSRCARLKNDRRGAKPGSTALPLFLSFSRSLSFYPSCLPLSLSSAVLSSLSLSRWRRIVFLTLTLENRISLFIVPNLCVPFFHDSFFFNSLLQDSLDSLGDYVSCYYSSQGTPPHIPSSFPFPPLLPAFLLRCRCYSSSSAIDLLIFSRRIFGAR